MTENKYPEAENGRMKNYLAKHGRTFKSSLDQYKIQVSDEAIKFREGTLQQMMRDQRSFFKRMSQNPNLTAQQHAFLAEMATIRHYIHCHPEQIFWNSKLLKKVRAYMAYIAFQENVNALGIDFPFEVCRQFSLLSHHSLNEDMTPKTLDENVQTFAEAANKLNDAFEDYLRTIGQKYGVHYEPTGWLREEKSLPDDHTQNKLYNAYFANGLRVTDGLSAQQFELKVKDTLIAEYPSLDSKLKIRYDKTLADDPEKPVFCFFVQTSDYDKLDSLGIADTLTYKDCKISLTPVDDVKIAFDTELPNRKKNLLASDIERR